MVVMCPSELRQLDSMLSTYRDLSVRVIEQQRLEGGPTAEVRRSAHAMRMDIEKFIGIQKKQARCVADSIAGNTHHLELLSSSV